MTENRWALWSPIIFKYLRRGSWLSYVVAQSTALEHLTLPSVTRNAGPALILGMFTKFIISISHLFTKLHFFSEMEVLMSIIVWILRFI